MGVTADAIEMKDAWCFYWDLYTAIPVKQTEIDFFPDSLTSHFEEQLLLEGPLSLFELK